MNIAAALLPLALFIYLLSPTAGLGVAEYFLSKTASPWPGRVLPILSALFSVCIAALLLSQRPAYSLFPAVLLALAALAVSYTHLDGYKRQVSSSAHPRALRAGAPCPG